MELEALLVRYNGLSTESKKAWNKLSPDEHKGERMRKQLVANHATLSALYNGFLRSPQLCLDKILTAIADEIRSGQRDATSVTTIAVDPASEEAWGRIASELADSGVSGHQVEEHKSYIISWFWEAFPEGGSSTLPQQVSNGVNAVRMLDEDPAQSLGEGASASLNISRTDDSDQGLPPDDLRHDPMHPWPPSQIIQYWNTAKWDHAALVLQQELQAVEAGRHYVVDGVSSQPDPRLLRHLVGVCASFHGDHIFAKEMFQSILPREFTSVEALDVGVLSAATWLGDTCVELKEAENAAIAWSLALIVGISKYGDRSARVNFLWTGLSYLNHSTNCLRGLVWTYDHLDADKSDILNWWPTSAKSRLVRMATEQLRKPCSVTIGVRPNTTYRLTEGYLVKALMSEQAWPWKHDPFFESTQAVDLSFGKTSLGYESGSITLSKLRTPGLGREHHYSGKQGADWLVGRLKTGLRARGISYKECTTALICWTKVPVKGMACQQLIAIEISKVWLRKVHVAHVSTVLRKTRSVTPSTQSATDANDARRLMIKVVKDILDGDVHSVSCQPFSVCIF